MHCHNPIPVFGGARGRPAVRPPGPPAPGRPDGASSYFDRIFYVNNVKREFDYFRAGDTVNVTCDAMSTHTDRRAAHRADRFSAACA
jgi:hypothetical protein